MVTSKGDTIYTKFDDFIQALRAFQPGDTGISEDLVSDQVGDQIDQELYKHQPRLACLVEIKPHEWYWQPTSDFATFYPKEQ